ncbi:LptF/LptG family permease [Ferruginibacter sp. SUN002]|uniref:LptF/LptG family permease n=1 Tax=Ferruginibacter sp. SUN002 TaxID=2937789 RepID=UPI003D3650D7
MKKLDKLILKSFIGPFSVTFFIAYFVILMQSLWKYVDDLVGKGLDTITVLKFLWYASASLLILVLPIAILISSIMTFGNLGERFELVAIKSSGISLLRFMRPLMWVALLLCGITFVFANFIIPNANAKFRALYSGILIKKPALDLKAGTFYTAIPNYAIKIAKKDPDGITIHNVIIYEQQNTLQDNCIIAEKGTMQLSADERYLEFTLLNGFRYQERGRAQMLDSASEFIRLGFTSYKKLIDIESLKLSTAPDSIYKQDSRAMNIPELSKRIKDLVVDNDSISKEFTKDVNEQLVSTNVADSVWEKIPAVKPSANTKNFADLIPDSVETAVNDGALRIVDNLKSVLMFSGNELEGKKKDLRHSKLIWQQKFSISFVCLVLFFIGAPLGSIIRKGGLGMPIVVAIVFFLLFHLLNIFGEKLAKDAVIPVVAGAWLPVFVLAPVGIFFTYKAMHDSQLFNKEFYYRFFKRVRSMFGNLLARK